MKITENTKISQLIRENPDSIDAIASISPHFQKLKNPFLRKVLASRVTIREAARIGGSTVNEFFTKLSGLGFEFDQRENITFDALTLNSVSSNPKADYELDVREDLNNGKDPFQKIMKTVSSVKDGKTLLLINSFEPVPLIKILEKKGFEVKVVTVEENLVYTYFKKVDKGQEIEADTQVMINGEAFNEKLKSVKGLIESVDVRNMEMPMPMVTILERLSSLADDDGLFVQHHKVPHFLLPELKERGYVYKITQEGPGEVCLLIYKEV